MKTIKCPRCGKTVGIDSVNPDEDFRCPYCNEPIITKENIAEYLDGWFLLCPECHSLSQGGGDWRAVYEEVNDYTLVANDRGYPVLRYISPTLIDSDLVSVYHLCDGVHETVVSDKGMPEDFAVMIKDGAIVKSERYWKSHKAELEEIAEKYGLKVKF